jgi:ring-1,2-phenylacetyl-CoA epoxidase subunit PaaD
MVSGLAPARLEAHSGERPEPVLPPGIEPDADALEIWRALATVADPELPMLSILDLGIVRSVERQLDGDNAWQVTITPTYSGCPAIDAITEAIHAALASIGARCRTRSILSPAWTTDWMSPGGRARLVQAGIAAPGSSPVGLVAAGSARVNASALAGDARRRVVACPRCGSLRTTLLSQFGSTACKALHRCDDCLEPFDEFKQH